jgi:superfamily II DNA/RNA helicase
MAEELLEGDKGEDRAEDFKIIDDYKDVVRDGNLEISENWNEITLEFDEFGFKEELLRGIYAYGGLEYPTPIQQVISNNCDIQCLRL